MTKSGVAFRSPFFYTKKPLLEQGKSLDTINQKLNNRTRKNQPTGVDMKANYKVTLVKTYTITVHAYDEDDAVEIATQIKFSDPEWNVDDDWSAEQDYEEDE